MSPQLRFLSVHFFMMFKTDVIMTITAIVATLIGFVLMTVIAKHSSNISCASSAVLVRSTVTFEEITQVIQL
mgnify:CR=1 FL=1